MRRRSRRMAKRAALQMHFVRRAAFCVVGEESRELKAAAVADEGARRALCGAKRLTSPFRRGALLGKLFFRENSRQVSKKLHRTALSRYNTASFVAFGNSLHVRGFQLALSSPTFLNAAFPTNSPPRRAAYGFAVCGRRRLSPPPHAAPPSRGRGGAPRTPRPNNNKLTNTPHGSIIKSNTSNPISRRKAEKWQKKRKLYIERVSAGRLSSRE